MRSKILGCICRVMAVTYVFVNFSLLFQGTASAYIDPATTAMLTQILAGVVITLGVVFGVYRRKIIMFFKNLSVKRTQHKIEKQNAKQKDVD